MLNEIENYRVPDLNTVLFDLPTPAEASSTMQAHSSARCTDVRLYTLRIKIGTNQRALGELSHY